MSHNIIKELSIQVNLNGLSFCILNTSENRIAYLNTIVFNTKVNPPEALERLKAELSSNTVFADDFKTVTIIHQNELASLVPATLYDEALNADYLKFNTKILHTDFISNDPLEKADAVNVYVPYVNVNNYIFDTFGSFTYKHASTIFIDAVLAQNPQEDHTLYVNVAKNAIEISAVHQQALQLYNRFEFFSAEDLIYYILFVVEQLGWNPETLHLKLSGQIKKNDENYNICYTYIRHVAFTEVKLNAKIPQDIASKANTHFIILNSF